MRCHDDVICMVMFTVLSHVGIVTIQSSGGLSKDQIERMVKEAEENAEGDKLRRAKVEAKNAADSLIHNAEKCVGLVYVNENTVAMVILCHNTTYVSQHNICVTKQLCACAGT